MGEIQNRNHKQLRLSDAREKNIPFLIRMLDKELKLTYIRK
jgi:hypothetical protein